MRHRVEHIRSQTAALMAFCKTNALIVAILVACLFGASEIVWAQGQPITFSAVGDVPYGDSEKSEFQQHMDDHDRYSPSEFLVHLGDIKAGGGSCTESWYSEMRSYLLSLSVPAFIIPGDNEWNDCDNPTQAWTYWTTYFIGLEQSFCGVPSSFERQSVRPENFAFVKSGVLFIGINMVHGGLGSQEEDTRRQQDADWVTFQMQTKGSTVRAAVIFAQGAYGQPFESQFRSSAVAFAKPVLYIMGDLHSWSLDSPYQESNITRVIVDRGSIEHPPVHVTVTMNPTTFQFNRNPWPVGTPLLNRSPCVNAGPDVQAALATGVVLNGKATDDADPGTASLAVNWTQVSGPGVVSFANPGALVTAAQFSAAGIYQLRLTASDGVLSTSDIVSVAVEVALNAPPYVDIIGPPSGSSYPIGQSVTLMGWAWDIENGDLTDTMTWTSDRDGPLGVSGQISTSSLSIGTHTITASVTDSAGAPNTDLIVVNIVGPPVGPTTLEIRVANESDDAEESATGSVSLTSGDLELVDDGTNQTVGVRFTGVSVPQTSTILNAWIQFHADGSNSTPASLTIRGQAADSPTTFTTAIANVSSRPRTTTSAAWSPSAWVNGDAGPAQRTPNLTAIIQDLVTRPGWSSGNSMAFIITGTGIRRATSYDGSPSDAPLLHIEFDPQSPPVVNAGPDQVVNLPNAAVLDATVSDDGLPNPPGAVTTTWSQVSGPGIATFQNPNAIDTMASFSNTGTYVLRLTANDGGLFVRSDDLTVTVTLAGEIDVVPTAADYGVVVAGTSSAPQTFTITNQGFGDLIVGAATLTGPDAASFAFVSGQPGATVLPGTSHFIEVRFSPLTGGPKLAYLSIPSNDPNENPTIVNLTGIASVNTTPTFMEVRTGGSSASTVTTSATLTGVTGHLYLAAVSTTPFNTVNTVTGLGLTWTRLAAQCGGRSATGTELWWAQGTATTGFVTATLASAPTNAVIAVARYSGVANTNPVTLLAAGNTNFDGTCVGGIDSAAYSFDVTTTDDPAVVFGAVARLNGVHTPGAGYAERVEATRGFGTTMAGVALVDRVVPVATTLPLNGSLALAADWAVVGAELRHGNNLPMPDIDVTPTGHDFGVLTIGGTATRTFTVRNLGNANLHVTSSVLIGAQAGEFAITLGGAPFTLAAGATQNLDVRFTPSLGVKTATLRLTSTDPDEPFVDLVVGGTGIAPVPNIVVTPASYNFGSWRVGQTVTTTFTVSNTGNASLVVGAPSLLGLSAAAFTVTGGQAGFVIAPGGSNTVQVQFLPLWGGSMGATLVVPSNDPTDTAIFVPLSGTAIVTTVPTFEEVRQGTSNAINVATTGSLTGISGHLYLAAVSTRPYVAVNTMTGLGLTWTRVAAQCTGQNQSGVELWWARGSAFTGAVTATLEAVPTNATIAAARYSGVAATNPIASLVAGNTTGVAGVNATCTGGVDNTIYSFGVTTTVNETMVVGAVARLDRLHTPGAGYTERADFGQGTGLAAAGLAFVDRFVPTISPLTLSGTLSALTDWAAIGIELRPSTSAPIPNINVVPNPHHDYGPVPVTTATTQTFVISNPGPTNLQITSTSMVGGQASQFVVTLGGAPFTLLPGTSRNVDVRFAPTSVGSKATTLRVKSANGYEQPYDVTLSGTGIEASDINLVPTTHNFGVVWFGATPFQTFTISNLGNLDLQVTTATLIGPQPTEFAIALGGAPFTVVPGATHNLDIRYAPTLVGPVTATLRLTTNDPDEATVDVILNGTGIAPPDVDITPTPYDFGPVLVGTPEVTVGTTATRTFVVRNLGGADLQVTATSLVGPNAAEFSIVLGGAPFTLPAGGTRNVDVRFAPTSGGPKSATLHLTTNDPDETLLDVALTATGTTAPEIDVVPPTHNYGVIWVNANASRTFTIRNVGTADLVVSAGSLVSGQFGEFAITSGGAPFTVAAGTTHSLTVQFAPTSSGPKSTTLQLSSNDVDEPTFNVALAATGIMPPDVNITPTPPYDFGSVLVGTPEVTVGTTATRTFVISNLGEVDLQVSATSLVGGQAAEFSIILGGAPFTLTPGGTRNLDVRFAPTSGGPKATTLRLTSNDPDETLLDLALTATGTTAPEIDVVPATHNYGVIWVNANSSRTFTIRNVGTADLVVNASSLVTGQFAEFAITSGGAPFTVAAGTTHSVTVQFAPTSSGPKSTTLQFSSNDVDEPTFNVALTATGIMPPDVDATPTPHNFGVILVGTPEVTVGTTSTQTFAIRNLGEADLQVTASSLVGGQVGEFAITAGGAPFTVSGGATRNLDVRFAPTSAGLKTTTLRLTNNDPDEAPLDVALSGTGTTAPEISVTPNPHNYGLVVLGVPVTRTFAVRNVGSADLHVSGSSLVGGDVNEFAIVSGGGSVTIAPGATHNLNVRFDPLTIGPKATTLRLTSDDQDESVLDVALSGTGKILIPDIQVTPASHDYGLHSIGTSVMQAFTVSNTGDGDVVVGTSSLSGPDVGAFAFVSGKNGFTIVPGGTNVIEVRFNAPTEGLKTATLTIPSNDPDENPVTIQLTGTGGPITPPVFMEMRQGGSSGSVNVQTATNLTGVNGDLYLAAISTRPTRTVNTVTGLGLTWTRVAAQCGGRNLTGVELWWAQGTATTGTVGATLASAPTSAVIAVTRYSGVASTNPVAPLVRGNTVGVNGACSGGSDSTSYSFNVTTTSIQSLVVGAVAIRHRTHTPGAGYTERAEVGQGSTTSRAGLALVEQAVPALTSLALNGTLSNTVDWAVIGVQVRPNTGAPIADIDVDPNPEHNYGDVLVGTTASQTFAVRNFGGATLQVSASTLVGGQTGEFSIVSGGAPFTVAPGATHNIDLRFAPTSGGSKSTTLQLTTDDPDEGSLDVALSGNATVAPEIDIVPAANDYGVIWLAQNGSRTFVVRNIGSADLQVTATSLVGVDAGEFGITAGAGAFTLVPGATHNIDVRFAPTSVGPKTATLRLANNDGNEATFDVSLTGTGITPPDIAATPGSHNYGDVLINTNTSRTFVITNLGGADLQVTASALVGGQAAEFAITSGGGSFTLASGATRNIDIRFAPTTAGSKATTLRLSTNDPDEASFDVALTGTGTIAPELDVVPPSHNYGVIWVGANGSRTFAIRNIGTADMQVTATSLVGTHAADFGITLGGGPFTVAPGATHNLDVRFAPALSGARTAALRLTTNDQDEATFDVALNGTGIMPPDVSVAPSPHNYGDVLVSTTATQTFVITNLGEADLQVSSTTLTGGDTGQFAIMLGGGSFTLAAGVTRNLDVRFAPTSGGNKTTALRLTSNDPDESAIDVTLSGTATTAPEIQVVPTTHNYGLVIVATGTLSRTFTVSNVGSADLHVLASNLVGGDMGEFAITAGGAPFTVAPGATHDLVVQFAPTSVGSKSTSLELTNDDENEASFSIALSGTGTILIPDIAVTPTSHAYGTQPVGTGVLQSFTFSNTGDGDVVVGPLSVSGPNAGAFTIMNGQSGFTITPGGSQVVDVRFAPASEGIKNATLTIPSNDPDENPVLVPLNGVGGPAAPPTFEEVRQGGSAGSNTVTTATSLLGVSGHVYLAAVGTRPYVSSNTVTGLGLTWTRVANRCGGRSQIGFDLWWAQGDATTGTVTSTLTAAASTASIAVARYSNVAPTSPVALLVSGNTNGINGACVNGTDNAAYSFNVTTTQTNSVVLGVVALRSRTHTPGSGYTERAELLQGSGGDAVTIVFTDRLVPTPTSVPLNGTLSGAQDWAVIGVELRYGTTVPMSDIDNVPTSQAYGTVVIGANATHTFAVRNVGNDDLDVSDIDLLGGDAAHFAVTQGDAPFTVAPGGTHNVDVRFSPTSAGSKAATLRLTSDDPDESPFDVALSGTGVTPPEIDVSPTSQLYGDVLIGASATRTITIRNLGGADLQVTASSLTGGDAGQFAITQGGAPFTLGPGATRNLDVRFTPTSGGLKSATLRLTSTDTDENPLDVALSGTGTTAPEIDVVPASHNYGTTLIGATSSQTFAVRNIGNADLQVTSVNLVGGQAGEFAVTLGGGAFTVAPGATHNIDVRFAPTSTGPKSTTLQLNSNDSDENPLNVSLNGAGNTPSDIDVAPGSHNYGGVLVGSNALRTFVVSNTGGTDLQVTATSLVGGQAAEFAITSGGGSFTLAAGAARNLEVRFSPTSGGPKATTLRLTSNDPDESPLDVALSGNATTAPEIDVVPTSHGYGLVVLNTTSSRTFTIRNLGSANLQVTGATLVGAEASEFAVTAGGAPFTVAPGATHNLDVGFTPTSTGPKATTLRLNSDDQDEPIVDVALSGTGTVLIPDIAVTPASHNYGTLGVGTSATQSFSVSNTGTGDLNVGASTLTGPDASEFAFVSGQAGFTITPGATNTIQVRFSPTTQVAKSATLTIPSNDPDENPVTISLSGTGGPATPPTFVDVRQGGSANLATVSTATAVTGATGHLYLAAISAKTHRQVTSVTGLGLTWTRLAAQCAGRNQTGLELWWAQGTATTGTVTATLASAPANALIAVARYSGVSTTNPVAPLVAGNSNGVNGACANGVDSAAYSFNVTTNQANALVFGVVAMRTQTNTPGAGYTERAEMTQSTGANMVSIAFADRAVPTPTSLPLNGTLSGAVDWAAIGVQLHP